jgi:NTE family protein
VRLAIVLTSVGPAGAVQAGLLVALAEQGLRPSLLVGSSAGALNAVFLAAHGGDHAAAVALARRWSSSGRVQVPSGRLEDAPVPVHVVAADARTAERRVLDRGPAGAALAASAAVPAVRWNGWSLLDGSLAAPGALAHALAVHDGPVLVLGRPQPGGWHDGGAAGVAVRALAMLAGRQLALDLAQAPSRVTVVGPPPADFSDPAALVDYGVAAGRRLLAGALDGLPDLHGRGGHVEMADAEPG